MVSKKVNCLGIFLFLFFYTTLILPQEISKRNLVTIRNEPIDSLDYNKIIAETTLETSLSSFVNLVFDTTAFTEWLYNCREAHLLERTSPTSAYYLFIYKSKRILSIGPADRYIISYAYVQQDTLTKTVEFIARDVGGDQTLVEAYAPEQDNLVQAEFFDAVWRFTPLPEGEVKAEYELYVDPGVPKILSPFVEGYVKEIARKSMMMLKEVIQKDKYQSPNPLVEEADRLSN